MIPEPQNICVLRLSAIGDVCHALSVVQQIQQRYPSCNITWIMGKIEAQLLGDLEGINVVVFDKKRGLKGMQEVWQQLKGLHFDYLLHMQVALRASLLTLGIKARKRVGFSWNRAKEGQWLFTNVKLPATDAPHVLDNFAQFALYLDCPTQAPKWNIPLAESDYSALVQLGGKPYIVISPAASKDERNWLPERYATIADYVAGKGYQVVLCGAPTDREHRLANNIIGFAETPIHNLVGQTNLKQLTAVLSKAEVVIAPDSGPAHIATTQGTPVIGLYAHSNPLRTGPYNSLSYVASVYDQLAEAQYGKAVSELPWGARVKGTDLMSNVSVELVEQQLDKILTEPQAEKSVVQ